MTLDPQAQKIIDATNALGLPPIEQMTPAQARESMRSRTAALGPVEAVARIQDHRVPVEGGEIAVRCYTPTGAGSPLGPISQTLAVGISMDWGKVSQSVIETDQWGAVSSRFGYSGAFVMGAAALGAAALAGRFVFPAGEMETSLAEEQCYETTP